MSHTGNSPEEYALACFFRDRLAQWRFPIADIAHRLPKLAISHLTLSLLQIRGNSSIDHSFTTPIHRPLKQSSLLLTAQTGLILHIRTVFKAPHNLIHLPGSCSIPRSETRQICIHSSGIPSFGHVSSSVAGNTDSMVSVVSLRSIKR
jgi:hypothetical protein